MSNFAKVCNFDSYKLSLSHLNDIHVSNVNMYMDIVLEVNFVQI